MSISNYFCNDTWYNLIIRKGVDIMSSKSVKARIQGNAVVVTIPKSFNVEPGTEFEFESAKDGALILRPTQKNPKTMKDLFKNWHGKYETPDSLKDWNDIKPTGEELW
ncbi:hypothetical protein ABVF11_07235 [Pediococcus argentinicus]|uniref:type II toxin-antitoxin system PemI/MazE family antitoxin n=1 Tax=Pediococcus argentinicus TaxID=480391 RepID=UPI00338EA6D1